MDLGWVENLLRDAPIAGAVIFVVLKFLSHIRDSESAFRSTMRESLDNNTQVIGRALGAIERLERELSTQAAHSAEQRRGAIALGRERST